MAALWLLLVPVFALHVRAQEPPPAPARAWVRFDDAGQEYQGTPYRFLGDGDLQLDVTVRPRPGDALALLWGAKNDARDAVLMVNGRTSLLQHGGYDGFEWWRVPLAADPTGDFYRVTFKAGGGKPAFLAEVRLVNERADGDVSRDQSKRSSNVVVAVQAKTGEAFPQMRALWDREPAAKPSSSSPGESETFRRAERHARQAAEALYRCRRYVDGWLAHADPQSGLIPRNLGRDRDLWNGRDSAADNYPFMVLTCALTDREMFEGRMRDMLRAEIRLTSRLGRLGDNFLFSKQSFARAVTNLDAILFDNTEYVKDGLIPLTEWLGPSAWSERMVGIMEDVWKFAPVEAPFGRIPTTNIEVLGDQLQACARLYWMTGERRFLEWGIRIGDYFLLGTNHPTRDFAELRLIDHGCEVVNGLSEIYVAVAQAAPEKKRAYEKPLHEMLARILEIGRNADGLLYTRINPGTGGRSEDLCDTWGYDYDAFYTVVLVDHTTAYRDAVRQALSSLRGKYLDAFWSDKSADGYADSIEGAINLYNREPIASVAEWIDSQTRMMWAIQKPDGVIEGWHGDGNFARTSIMYALWKAQGAHVEPWREDVRLGAVREDDTVFLSVAADRSWRGRVVFDKPRHKTNLHLPFDYPRINQFPEWFTTEPGRSYTIRDAKGGTARAVSGADMQRGIALELEAGAEVRWSIAPD